MKYLRIHLIVLAAVLALLGLGPFTRRAILQTGSSLLGARLEATTCRVQPGSRRIHLTGIRIVDRQRSHSLLLQADRGEAQIDADALASGRIEVVRCCLNGIRLPSQPYAPQATPSREEKPDRGECSDGIRESVSRWVTELNSRLAVQAADPRAMLRATEAMRTQWSSDWEKAQSGVEGLQSNIRLLGQSLEEAGSNRLRNLAPYQKAPLQLEDLNREFDRCRAQVEQLTQALPVQRETQLAEHRRRMTELAATLDIPNGDPTSVSSFLLYDSVGREIQSILGWIAWSRYALPVLRQQTPVDRVRGETILLGRGSARPNILIDTLVVAGTGGDPQSPYHLEGMIRGLSNQPERNDQPTEMILQITGAAPVAIRALLDARSDKQRDHLEIHCPHRVQPDLQWGRPDVLAVMVPSCTSRWSMVLDICENELSGTWKSHQTVRGLSPRLLEARSQQVLTAPLAASLAQVQTVEVAARISGSLDFPRWQVTSPLGQEISAGIRQAMASDWVTRHQPALDQWHEEFWSGLAATSKQNESRLQKSLADCEQQLRDIHSSLADRVRQTDGLMEARSPLREVLQR